MPNLLHNECLTGSFNNSQDTRRFLLELNTLLAEDQKYDQISSFVETVNKTIIINKRLESFLSRLIR